jgi:flagellar biosynthesis protein FliP
MSCVNIRNKALRIAAVCFIVGMVGCIITCAAWSQQIAIPDVNIKIGTAQTPGQVATNVQILLLLTVLTLAPSIIIMVTAFTRIAIVLAFTRQALATQQIPPNQVMMGLALFLTFFVMAPIGQKINTDAVQPYLKGQLTQAQALTNTAEPLREFMFRQTRQNDLALFIHLSKLPRPASPKEVPTHVLIPAFIISELKTSFQMGFIIFIPFLVIDIVVSSALMAMGMMLLPPVVISFPFKILLFIMVDGWHLIARSLVFSFR